MESMGNLPMKFNYIIKQSVGIGHRYCCKGLKQQKYYLLTLDNLSAYKLHPNLVVIKGVKAVSVHPIEHYYKWHVVHIGLGI